ncbi:uncharacterized protein At3g61260-like [Andrographis paniculata]|uniref:uncharacterized protein At3g61260-like n=1 Tax=Andrographis paniculata TaxID=175694 RepID=UPI0021E7938B|nr:uncharacterized protein At3g61260-like [Andrographis paniculata]
MGEEGTAKIYCSDEEQLAKPAGTDHRPQPAAKSNDRDDVLAQVEREKRLALIKAWEDNEKSKADNKAYKKLSTVDAWENSKRASIEVELKKIEENIEKKKAEYAEKMKNKMAIVRKTADEKRAMVEADRGRNFLAAEESAEKYRAAGAVPKKSFACFSC